MIFSGDAGELTVAAAGLGIPHNPGYPIFCLLGKLSSFLSSREAAYSVNVSSALAGAMTVAVVFLVASRFCNSRHAAFWGALFFAFSPLFWSQATSVEVYCLATLYYILILGAILSWHKKPSLSCFLVLVFLISLGLGHHLSLVLSFPALIFLIISTYFSKSGRSRLFYSRKIILNFVFGATVFILGLSVYLYLPIRSSVNPVIDWRDTEHYQQFIDHVSARVHRSSAVFSLSEGKLEARILDLYQQTLRQFGVLGSFASLAGWVMQWFANPWLGAFFLILALGEIFYILFLNTVPLAVTAFGLQLYLLMAITISFFLAKIFIFIRANLGRSALKISYLVLAGLVFIIWVANFAQVDASEILLTDVFAKTLLASTEYSGLFFAEGDNFVFPLAYLTKIKMLRPDLTIVDRMGNLFEDVYGLRRQEVSLGGYEGLLKKVELDLVAGSKKPVYYSHRSGLAPPAVAPVKPFKFLYKVGNESSKGAILASDFEQISGRLNNLDYMCRLILSEFHIRYGENLLFYKKVPNFYNLGSSELEKASWAGAELKTVHYNLGLIWRSLGELERAIEEYQKALLLDPEYAEVYNNLGFVYSQKKLYNKALEAFEKAVQLQPRYLDALNNLGFLYAYWKKDAKKASYYWNCFLKYGGKDSPDAAKIEKQLQILQTEQEPESRSGSF